MGDSFVLPNRFMDLSKASGSPFPPRWIRRRRRRPGHHHEPRLFLLIAILLVSSFCLFKEAVSFPLTRGLTDYTTMVSFHITSSTSPSSTSSSTTTAASRSIPRRRLDKSRVRTQSLAVGPLTAVSTSSSPDNPLTTSNTPATLPIGGTTDQYHQWKVGNCIGSGSYGTVHYLEATPNSQSQIQRPEWFVGKRAWKVAELENNPQRQDRCQYYWQVEAHCFAKLPRHPQLPPYYGTTAILSNDPSQDQRPQHDEWMVFGPILSSNPNEDDDDDDAATIPLYNPSSCPPPLAKSLAHYMELDWQHGISMATTTKSTMDDGMEQQLQQQQQRLPHLSKAMGSSNDTSTLDTLFSSLLSALVHIHDSQIVHRDLKPSNILIAEGGSAQQQPRPQQPNVVLIDFGSAADLEPLPSASLLPFPSAKRYMGLDVNEQRVAVSPLYCAPETFIDPQNSPLAFDLSSCGLILCQFIFGYLEERSDAGFRQQLLVDSWDLNRWLANQLASKVRPEGLEDALAYLGDRPGLWTLLQDLLEKEPKDRPTAKQAQARLTAILEGATLFQTAQNDDNTDCPDRLTLLEREDGPFFAMVVESIEACQLPTVSRPLHFVATFSRKKPLGLVFSEIEDDDDGRTFSDDPANQLWIQATKDAVPGEVFIKDIVSGGQADKLGIFEIGDRLQGVGELTFTAGGFEKAVEMLQDQPRSARNVRLHFDRLKVRDNSAIPILPPSDTKIAIVDQGLWSSKGRRQTQEDAFVLHEIHATKDRSVLLMGVMDGHGGTAASKKVAEELPLELTNQIVVNRRPLESSLKDAWETVCQSYQLDCQDQGECVADYDNRQGALDANTGSIDLIAGTTASVMALDETNGELVTLNCGDSRSIVVTPDGLIQVATRDHTPQSEAERLQQGVASGLDYSLPTCKISKWTILAGKYEYSVGRSLEGPFVRSKGIVSDADVTCTYVGVGEILLCATDGLWEVMDSEEIAMDLAVMRKQGMNARDCARAVCSMALEKGTTDNVSAVIVYL